MDSADCDTEERERRRKKRAGAFGDDDSQFGDGKDGSSIPYDKS
jgi:hypothetical protein